MTTQATSAVLVARRPRLATSLGAYLLVFAPLVAPWLRVAAWAEPASSFQRGDQRILVWVLAWVSHSLATAPAHLFDANINYPAPGQLATIEHLLSSQLVFGPLYALTRNPVLAANLTVIISYPLAALAMERCLLALGCGRSVAWVSGLAFALGPIRVPGTIKLLQLPNLYLPLVALALTRLRERATTGAAAALAAALLLAFLASYYAAVMAALVAVLWGFFELPGRRPGRVRYVGLALLAFAVAA